MSGTEAEPDVSEQVRIAFRDFMIARENIRNIVYADSLGILTVGIGHRVTQADNLRLGDTIDDQTIENLFAADSAGAIKAACAQAASAGIASVAFITVLASVNFQLGTDWRHKFPHTWKTITDGRYAEAASELNSTRWQQQTPSRVADFQKALLALAAPGIADSAIV
jgi:GH24 family phage-related lysozyme (muramidase)